MRLADFIRQNSQQIIVEWEDFSRTLVPAVHEMSPPRCAITSVASSAMVLNRPRPPLNR